MLLFVPRFDCVGWRHHVNSGMRKSESCLLENGEDIMCPAFEMSFSC